MNQKNIVVLTFLAGLFGVFFLFRQSNSSPKIRVMTYSSFLSPYGPAHEIQKRFEKNCKCQIQWMKAEDSTLMIQKLKLRSDGLGIDVVLGLDQLTFNTTNQKWKEIKLSNSRFIPKVLPWIHPSAAPISWAPFTFIAKKQKYLPKNIPSLLDSYLRKKISIPHPHSSTVGLQFYFWIFSLFKKTEPFLHLFKKQVYTLSHSWSSSYGLFQKEFAPLAFSYQTSIIYHLVEENKQYFSARFSEGHPYQVELAAIPGTCVQCDLAQNFLNFLLEKSIQKILMTKNYMFPVTQGVVQGTPFENLEELPLISYEKINSFLLKKDEHLKNWDRIFNSR